MDDRLCFQPSGTAVLEHHPPGDGVNVALMDGSVRSIRDSIALIVWQGLAPGRAAKSCPISTELPWFPSLRP
jgi:hypothetical protein